MSSPSLLSLSPARGHLVSSASRRARAGKFRFLSVVVLALSLCTSMPMSRPAYAQEVVAPSSTSAGGHVAPAATPEEAASGPASGQGSASAGDEGGGWVVAGLRALLMEFLREVFRLWELGLPVYVVRGALALVGLVAGFLFDQLSRVCCGPLNFFTRTPAELSYANPAVVGLWEHLRTVANAALAVLALWGGLGIMMRRHLGTPYPGALELFPRLALGAFAANTSRWWAGRVIDINNGLCEVVGLGNPYPVWDSLTQLDRAAVEVIAFFVYVVAGVLLFFQQLARLALVDLLVATSPLGILCWVLPETQGWARLWGSTFSRVVFAQFLQVVVLKLGASLLSGWAAALSWPATDVLSIFVGVAVLGLAFKVPSLLQAHVGDGMGFVRYLAYREGGRAVGGAAHALGGLGQGAGPRVVQLAMPLSTSATSVAAAATRVVSVSGVVRSVGRR